MLKPRQMSRLLIAASKDQMEPVIQELYRHGVFHIEEFVDQGKKEYEGFRIGMPLAGAGEVSSDLLKIRSLTAAYMVKPDDEEPDARRRTAEIRSLIERDLPAIEKETEGLTTMRSRLETEEKELEQKIAALKPFAEIPVDLDLLRGYESLAVFAGSVTQDVVLEIPHERFYSPSKAGNFIVVIVPVEHRSQVEKTLNDVMFQPVQVPGETGPASAAISSYQLQIISLTEQIAANTAKLEENRKKYAGFLLACDELLTTDVSKAEAPLRFATTDQSFVAEGWVPVDKVAGLTAAINQVTNEKCYVTELPVDLEHDAVPMEYANPSFARPAQLIMDTYARPRYTEIDPTLIISFVFPLFFGLILGDVGYGLMLLGLSLVLRHYIKRGDGAQLVNLLTIFAISSIIFGILFSEFLGFKLPWEPLIFSRHMNIGTSEGEGAAIPALMVMSIWIGIVYITLGRVLGIINHARMDHGSHRTKAVLANVGWIFVMWGILFMIWSAFPIPYMPDFTVFPAIVAGLNIAAIIGAVMLVLGIVFIARDSPLEIVEVPTIISHTLSFARLVAVGLSSVAIAMVVNLIAIGMIITPQLQNFTPVSIVIIIVGALVFIVGHLGNCVLGLIGGGLQSLRLQYVEFFTKFYKGGGVKYNPFGMIRRFTED
jgi:V/A-type H+-transporting ATPase subunit I